MTVIRIILVLFNAWFFSTWLSLPALSADYSTAWFKPEIALNKSPHCEQIKKHTIDVLNGKSRNPYPTTLFTKEPSRNKTVAVNGVDIHISTFKYPGCGGACEQHQIMASTTPLSNKPKHRDDYTFLLQNSPPKGDFDFLSSPNNEYFVLTKNRDEKGLFKLNSDASWDKVCSIVNKFPQREETVDIEEDYQSVRSSLKELRVLVDGLRQDAGRTCGSMRTHSRWTERITQEFSNLLYSPSLEPKGTQQHNDSTYEIDIENLKLWSITGVNEHKAFIKFQTKLPMVIVDLSLFYQKRFGWSEGEANQIADYALKSAISSGIRFYNYKPFKTQEELELRKAIIDKKPISDIKNIDISAIPKAHTKRNMYTANESILNVAVMHPEALTYLIKSGFDVNNKNIFNKTPLMYAAQHNIYDAVKILIKSGAHVNSGTIIPEDTCGYTLKTKNMTPLHYALRYANKDVIDLLLESGASKFHYVENRMERPSKIEYPVDWLTRFDNPLLSEEDKIYLEAQLKLPPSDELSAMSKKLNLNGEKLYADKLYQEASIQFKEATYVDVNNVRAFNNYALVSLKLDHKADSLAASANVIRSKTATDKQKASAHFNTGLACEGAGRYGIYFNGTRYCRNGPLTHYIAAYKGYPTTSRANAIVERFKTKKGKHDHQCVLQDGRFDAVMKIDNRKLQFLHKQPLAESLDNVHTLEVTQRPFRLDKQPVVLKRKDMLELQNDYTISTYTSSEKIYDNFSLDEGVCTSSSSVFIDESTHFNFMENKYNKR